MIEGKVRESIYIVKPHTGATQRTNITDRPVRRRRPLKIVARKSCGRLLELLLVSYKR